MQDMLAQIAADDAVLSPIQPLPAPMKYAFEERARIAQVFLDPPLSAKDGGNLDRQIAIIDDFISLCARRERCPRKLRQLWENNIATTSSDNNTPDIYIKLECSDSDSLPRYESLLQYQRFQCLFCIGDAGLPLYERQQNFGSK